MSPSAVPVARPARIARDLVCLFLCVFTCVADNSPASAESPKDFGEFRAVTSSGQHVYGTSGRLDTDFLRGRRSDGSPVEVPRSELRLLDVRDGSMAKTGASIGAAVGGLIVLAAVLEVHADENAQVNGDAILPVTAASAGIGALVGAIIGSRQKSWSNVELGPSQAAGPAFRSGVIAVTLRF